jgi:ribonuclease D
MGFSRLFFRVMTSNLAHVRKHELGRRPLDLTEYTISLVSRANSFPQTVPVVPWFEANFEGPAVVQISTCKGAIVVHLVDVLDCDKSKETIPMLKSLLADQTIVKAGVGIDQDMIELYRDWGNEGEIRSRFDIGGIGGEVGRTSSLKDLAKAFLGVDLPKSKRLSRSNWSRLPLSEKQIAYCARDAWAAAAILFELAKRKPELFSSRAIQQLLEGEFPIAHLEKRSVDRKAAKKRFLQLIEVSQETRTPEMREEINKLREAMNQLAPPNPFFFGPELSGENSLR